MCALFSYFHWLTMVAILQLKASKHFVYFVSIAVVTFTLLNFEFCIIICSRTCYKMFRVEYGSTFHRWNIPSFIHLFCVTYTFVSYTFLTCILVMQSLMVVICLLLVLHEGAIYKRRLQEWGRGY